MRPPLFAESELLNPKHLFSLLLSVGAASQRQPNGLWWADLLGRLQKAAWELTGRQPVLGPTAQIILTPSLQLGTTAQIILTPTRHKCSLPLGACLFQVLHEWIFLLNARWPEVYSNYCWTNVHVVCVKSLTTYGDPMNHDLQTVLSTALQTEGHGIFWLPQSISCWVSMGFSCWEDHGYLLLLLSIVPGIIVSSSHNVTEAL